jgi:DNA polymerase I
VDALVFDLETDGLLDTVSKIHCVNALDRKTGRAYRFHDDETVLPRDGSVEDGLVMVAGAECIAGQNIIGYDLPVIRKLRPLLQWRPGQKVFDTQIAARVIWPEIADKDFRRLADGRLPEKFRERGLIGTHKLEAWGYRLGNYKGDFDPKDYGHTWATIPFSQDMSDYGAQDVTVTNDLLDLILKQNYSQECLDLEHRVAEIIFRQTERGFAFDMKAAEALVEKLQKRHAEISGKLASLFEPWMAPDVRGGTAVFTPKKDNRPQGYTGGAPFSRMKQVVFNAASRDHIADRLMTLRGWKPSEFTDGGKPKVDETVLGSLPYPEAAVLSESMLIEKRLGQIATGDEAWMKHARTTGIYGRETDGVLRIHGYVNSNGAVTGRMSHSKPNVAQTPKVGVPYGAESRACFIPTPGLVLVGCDAEGLELRCLAHYMARWDGGAYGETVVNGRKEDGTDVHTVNQKAAGLNSRDSAKTFVYALLYGAGDYKLGSIVYEDFTEDQRKRYLAKYTTKRSRENGLRQLGKNRRARLMESLPAFAELVKAVKQAAKRGFLKGLDGRRLHVRSEHAALNTLLQAAGAIVMKKGIALLDEWIKTRNLRCFLVASVHDEWQFESPKETADDVGKLAASAITAAGEYYKFRCPLSGSYGIGASWAETH